jgi:arabinan endo-1,5-alpha-L-arabinosidase
MHNFFLTLRSIYILSLVLGATIFYSCEKSMPIKAIDPLPMDTTKIKDITTLDDGPIDFNFFQDQYGQISSPNQTKNWAHYNVHDPAYLVDEKFTYCYNTDVAFGTDIQPGIQIRRSINLVEWEFVGWAFGSIPGLGSNYIIQNGGKPNNSLWAPCIVKVGNTYRLYYSLSSNVGRLSVIGLATSTSPKGPFQEKGLVVTSKEFGNIQTNAIDPTVIVDQNGKHWMYYGSAWDGIYKLEIDPSTGLAVRSEDKGVRVAQRGTTNGKANGNIEGAEIIYNDEFKMYYLFIAYDWLETKYNVRVGRSQNALGPFVDMAGKNINDDKDDLPMILAPYKFNNHSGWQGVSHCGVFKKNGAYYMGHQGRPGSNPFYMIMHTRQLLWTNDGWPLVSSQRYAKEEETSVNVSELAGDYEWIDFEYKVIPGYGKEQIIPDFSTSKTIILNANGLVNQDPNFTWSYTAPWLSINDNGTMYELRVERGRDWENNKESTILFTGLGNDLMPIWAKKTN